jgi:hypothetical protein
MVRDRIAAAHWKQTMGEIKTLMIDMKNQKPVGAHGDEQIGILY